ncbi:YraN family protein [Sediminitomix flava]|uniref:UPF0102 protein BC781_104289 n=1 Tax=Sediminitomix flava TaxID=379075 RepID=A0A315Z7T7_SEDFL|nr:YraN family protein [Sediminitomix flava]PWJ41022.1 putative endonuclease [Sediminitomix flava]
MGNNHLQKGKKGELIAREYLTEKGYEILAQNYRYKRSEVDIIAFKSPFLVFIEVKYRSSDRFGFPEAAVSSHKEKMLKQAAEFYLENFEKEAFLRFDIVAILERNTKIDVQHFEDAFF